MRARTVVALGAGTATAVTLGRGVNRAVRRALGETRGRSTRVPWRTAIAAVTLYQYIPYPGGWGTDHTISNLAGDIFGSIFGFLDPVYGWVKDKVTDAFQWIIQPITVAWNLAEEAWGLIHNVLYSVIPGIYMDVARNLADAITDVRGYAVELVNGAVGWLQDLAVNAWNLATELSNNLYQMVTDIVEVVLAALIETFLAPLWDAIEGVAGFVWEDIIGNVRDLIEEYLDLYSQIGGFAARIVEEGLRLLFDVGGDVIHVIRVSLRFAAFFVLNPTEALEAMANELLQVMMGTLRQEMFKAIEDYGDYIGDKVGEVIGLLD